MPDAISLSTNRHGVRLVLAKTAADSWPGWACPLGAAGYWIGTDQRHTLVDADSVADVAKIWGGDYDGPEWFAATLNRLRDAAGYNGQELADMASLSRQRLHQLESGTHKPTWAEVQQLAAALKVPTDTFRDQ